MRRPACWIRDRLSSRHVAFIFLFTAAAMGRAASAQENQHPLEPVDRSSPRSTLVGFIDACNEIYEVLQQQEYGINKTPEYEHLEDRLIRCLNLSEQPKYVREYVGKEAAVCLKEVLDRIELPADDTISDGVRFETSASGELNRWTIPHTEITIAQVMEGPREGEFLFDAETVDRAVTFYQRVKDLPYRTDHHPPSEGFYDWFLSEPASPTFAALVHKLPQWTFRRVFGQAIWQWVALLLTIVVGALLMGVAYGAGRVRGERARQSTALWYCLTMSFPIAAMLVPLLAVNIIEDQLAITGLTLIVAKFVMNLVFLLALIVVLIGAGNRIGEVIIAHPRIQTQGLDAQLVRIVCRVLSIVAAIIVFLEGGKHLGIPLSTLVASAGVTGLAVALAAQDSLKSVFGSMMILLDKPYRIGERIIFGGYDGIVEEIGLRSTKVRLLTGHMAALPNEEMARSKIENVGRRPHIRRMTDLHLPLDTPRGKVEQALTVIRAALADHEGMQPDFPPRIYFNEFNPDSFNIRVIYWYHPPKYWDFLAFSEQVNLTIFRAFDDQGISFSLPARVAHVTPDNEQRPLEVKLVADDVHAANKEPTADDT